MQTTDNKGDLFAALVAAQSQMGAAARDGVNSRFATGYASLASVLAAIIPALSANGLAMLQHPSLEGDLVSLETVIIHTSGQFLSSVSSCPLGKRADAHALGSAITYLRRYSAMSIMGCPSADDDGNRATDAPAAPAALVPVPRYKRAELEDLLSERGVTLSEVTEFLRERKRPAPLQLSRSKQEDMLRWLGDGGGADLIRQAGQ